MKGSIITIILIILIKWKLETTIKLILRARQRPGWCDFPYRTALAPAAGILGAPRAFAAAHAHCRQPCLGHFLGSAVRCPWALCQLQPARFSCTQHLEGHVRPRCSCRCAGMRMRAALVRSCRRCRAGVIFTPCQQSCAALWPYYNYTGTSVSREALKFLKV